jgi:hypothetical protein
LKRKDCGKEEIVGVLLSNSLHEMETMLGEEICAVQKEVCLMSMNRSEEILY